jgi:glycosyltransferase involved in cell wall biosynthesis
MPKVSVIIPTFNGAKRGFLAAAIESVLNQTFKDFELILSDDGSTDKTKDLCQKYLKQDHRIKYFYQQNLGISATRNLGIKNCSGKYIAFLDDDDLWLPEKLEKQVRFFEESTDHKLGMTHTWVAFVDENEKRTGCSHHSTSGNIHKKLFKQNIINATSSVMIRKDIFDSCGVFRPHMITVEDYELYIRIAKKYHIHSINEELVKYRVHHIEKLSECYKKNIIYSQLVLYYAFEDRPSNNYKDEFLSYSHLYKIFAKNQLAINNCHEFRKYCRLANVYGSLGFSLKARYWISFFPKALYKIRRLKRFLF